jgi:hypothetical protein
MEQQDLTWHQRYYLQNKEKIKQQSRARYINYKESITKKFKARKESNWEHQMYINSKCRAKRHGIEFTITEADIVIPKHCPYLGIELTRVHGNPFLKSLPSIDRIDNQKGYIPGNIQVISKLANAMKNTASKEELIAFAHGILHLYGEEQHGTK